MDQEFIKVVSELPLEEKAKAIAISYHLDQWVKQDQELKNQVDYLKRQHLKSLLPLQKEINAIINATRPLKQEEIKSDTPQEELKPIKNFWGKVLLNNALTSGLMSKEDEKIMESLISVEAEMGENDNDFRINFHFAANDYFDECILKKEYLFETPKATKPYDSKGTQIKWKEGKNVTRKIQKKKQNNKKTGKVREVVKEIKAPSFFHFFENLDAVEEEEKQERLEFDYQLGSFFINQMIPESLGYYLGVKHEEGEDELEELQDDDESYGDSQDQE